MNLRLCLVLVCSLLWATFSSTAVQAVTPKVATQLTLKLPVVQADIYNHLELTIATDAVVANPFDPAQIDLWVRFSAADGQVVRVPAFWYQEFDPATLKPKGAPGWRVRFTPTAAGQWRAQAELANPKLTSQPVVFTVSNSGLASGGNHGFVRVDAHNPHYFAFDDGTFYFPIGLNIGWSNGDVLGDYERWLTRLGGNGGNLARVWMAAWSFGIEWKETGLGDYTLRMKQAWLLDQVFELAEKHGVYILLTLVNHGPFSTTVNPEWADNPYNVANAGPLKSPADFTTSPQAKDYFKRRLRYIAARWSASPHLFAWEWWNEVNWTPLRDDTLGPWMQEMTTHLHQFDPYQHLVSSSYADGKRSKLWQMPELSFTQQHDYSGLDPVQEFQASLAAITATAPNKPILMAEQGFAANGDEALQQELIHLHNGLWVAPFLGYAGSSLYWWWDTLVDPHDLWDEYGALAAFLQGEALPLLAPGKAEIADGQAVALTLQNNTHALLWLRNADYTANLVQEAYNSAILKALKTKQKLTDWQYKVSEQSGLTVIVTGLQDGAYTAQWYDPQTGAWLIKSKVTAKQGKIKLQVPTFNKDLAVKIKRE